MINLTIPISNTFDVSKINSYIGLNNILINEAIINYGILLYEHENKIFDNKYNKDCEKVRETIENKYINDIEEITNKYKNMISKNEIDYNSKIHDIILENQKKIKDATETHENTLTMYKSTIDTLKNNINNIVISTYKEVEINMEKNYKSIMDCKNNELQNLEKQQQQTINILLNTNNQLVAKNNDLQLQINTQETNIKNKVETTILDGIENIKEFNNKMFNTTSMKGVIGEKYVWNYLFSTFPSCTLENKSGTSHCGDILFSDSNVKTLIEVKFKNYVSENDIDKFYDNIAYSIKTEKNENEKINSAIFIALQPSKLNKLKKSFHFEFIDNVFIIFISNVVSNNDEYIRFSILIITYLINSGFYKNKNRNNTLNYEKMFDKITKVFQLFKNEQEILNEDKKIIKQLNENILKRISNIQNIIDYLEDYFNISGNKLPITKTIPKDEKQDFIINHIKRFHIDNPNIKITAKNLLLYLPKEPYNYKLTNYEINNIGIGKIKNCLDINEEEEEEEEEEDIKKNKNVKKNKIKRIKEAKL